MIFVISIGFLLISLLVSWRLKSKFKQYSQIGLATNLSGQEIAQKMLRDNGINDVRVISVEGSLTDHYNPADKTVNLSPDVFYGRSVAAAAVAAHECRHAAQHAQAYTFLQFRSALVPALSFTSRYMSIIIFAGVMLLNTTPIPLAIGVVLFALTTLFSFITLPVEFDASRRALAWIDSRGIVTIEWCLLGKISYYNASG